MVVMMRVEELHADIKGEEADLNIIAAAETTN